MMTETSSGNAPLFAIAAPRFSSLRQSRLEKKRHTRAMWSPTTQNDNPSSGAMAS